MLRGLTLPASWRDLLEVFRPAFRRSSTFAVFALLATGLVAQAMRRTVVGMLAATGMAAIVSFHTCCRFFSVHRWDTDRLGLALARVIVSRLLPGGAAIEVVVDDTLFRRWGPKVFGAFWTHDGSAQDPHARFAAVGPTQRQHRVGERGHRRTGLHPRGLPRLQTSGSAFARGDGRDHGQRDVGVAAGIRAHHVDAAHGVAIDGSLIESGQRALGDHLFGAHQALSFGNRHPHRPRRHRSCRNPGLLLLNRTHSSPFCIPMTPWLTTCSRTCGPTVPPVSGAQRSARPNRSTNHRRNSGP